jgi:predicted deacetylase
LNVQQQKDILDHTYNLLTEFNHGVPPKGSVAPWWEVSAAGTNLLLEKGIEYGGSICTIIGLPESYSNAKIIQAWHMSEW